MAEAGATRKENGLYRVPSTPNARARLLNSPFSPARSMSLSPSRQQKAQNFASVSRAGSISPLRHRRLPSASPAPGVSSEKRQKLKQYNTVEDAVGLLKDSTNVVILSGAGISTAVGIPDFRSKQGLYSQVSARFTDPQQLFYRENFEDNPLAFWEDVHPIVPKLKQGQVLKRDGSGSRQAIEAVPRYSKVHSFFDLLQSKDKLNTIFTQNIDALELAADIEAEKIIACHGSWDTATCLTCDGKAQADEYLPVVLEKKLPLCACARPQPTDPNARQSARPKKPSKVDSDKVSYLDTTNGQIVKPASRTGRKKRRAIESELAELLRKDSDDDDKFDPPAQRGLLKPDITFFGEPLNPQYFPRLNSVKGEIDLLIIIGTSLAAEPVSKLPLEIPAHVPQIWISNQTTTSAKARGLRVDIELVGDADTIITELCARAGWSNGLTNRLWRNHLGSNKQAKAAKAKALLDVSSAERREQAESGATNVQTHNIQEQKNKAASEGANVGSAPVRVLGDLASSSMSQKVSEHSVATTHDNSNQANELAMKGATVTSNASNFPTAAVKSEEAPSPLIPPKIVTMTAPPALLQHVDTSPSKSPPLPFRSSTKRPFSIGDALCITNAAVPTNEVDSDNGDKALRIQPNPERPVKAARTASTLSAVGKYDAVSDPELTIFPDEAFSNIIYFKKRK